MFKRKPKNRRHEHKALLDVKLRSRHVRGARLRAVALIFAAIAGIAAAIFALPRGSEWVLQELVYNNQSFTVRRLDIRTNGRIPLAQIRDWSGVRDGDNLLKLDLLRIKNELELSPHIQSAVVERFLPNTLRIQVIERREIAQVAGYLNNPGGPLNPTIFYLDDSGHVMLPLRSRYLLPTANAHLDALPMLFGVPMSQLRPGKMVESQQILDALRLILAFSRADIASQTDIKSIDLSAPALLEITTSQGSRVTFAPQQLPHQLSRWNLVHHYAAGENLAIAELDLSVTNNAPAKWVEASALPPRKPLKPSALKNRNA